MRLRASPFPCRNSEIGNNGNTHFPFSDLNNVQIADLVSKYLAEKRLV